jgi:hypothetical protein
MRENPAPFETGFREGGRDGGDARQVTGAAAGYAQRSVGGGVTKVLNSLSCLPPSYKHIACQNSVGKLVRLATWGSKVCLRPRWYTSRISFQRCH